MTTSGTVDGMTVTAHFGTSQIGRSGLGDLVRRRTAASPATARVRVDGAADRLRRSIGGRHDDVVVTARAAGDLEPLLAQITPGELVVLDVGGRPRSAFVGARTVAAARSIDETLAVLDAELAGAPAALVVVDAVSPVTGEVLPIGRLAAAAHRHGARILVGAERLIPHRAVSIASWGIDFALISGHALDVPFEVTVLVGRADWLAAASVTVPAPPAAFGVEALASAVDQIASIGFEHLGYREHALHRRLAAGLARLPGVRLLRTFDDPLDHVGVVAFAVDGQNPGDVVQRLSVRHGISGCDHRPDPRGGGGGAVRFHVGLGTTSDDVDRLLRALAGTAAAA